MVIPAMVSFFNTNVASDETLESLIETYQHHPHTAPQFQPPISKGDGNEDING
jgi:hypothetical protein